MRVARTYRLEPELILRVEEAADSLGQSLTVFVTRALEKALREPSGPAGEKSVTTDVRGASRVPDPAPSRAPTFESPPALNETQAVEVGRTVEYPGVVRASSLVEQVSEPFYDDGETPGG